MEIMKLLRPYEDVIKDLYLESLEENTHKIFHCHSLRIWKISRTDLTAFCQQPFIIQEPAYKLPNDKTNRCKNSIIA